MVGILAEKPSAKKNFAKALGGTSGSFRGTPFIIEASHGHLYGLATPPKEQVPEDYQDDIATWDLTLLPWNEKRFAWKKRQGKGAKETLNKIKEAFKDCDEICIATDDDPSGEGQLLGWEIVHALHLDSGRKVTRMYFVDETEKSVQKAFLERKTLPPMNDDPEYKKAFYRERWDYLSMQFSRIATLCGDSHSVLRQGRLKSAMVVLVGDQLKAVKEYKKIPYYQNRFKDENGIVYSNPEEHSFPKRSDVPDTYHNSDVVLDSKEMKHTAPGKLLDLSSLSSILAGNGVPSKVVLDTYQKMYEDHILSYPRTEDKFISPEQFTEMLPLIDRIADVVGVDKSLLTHRTPRKTHVKTGGTHGANRPGTTVPKSLDSLKKYGSAAPLIYETLAKNFLAMFGEDYEYEQQKGHIKDYPKFTGTASIPKKQGWKAIFSESDDDEAKDLKGIGTHASPFIYEGFPKKPVAPTMKWLMKQLESRDIGTGATRTSTYAEVTQKESEKNKYPLLADTRGKISMTRFGEMSYIVTRGSRIADLGVTKAVQDEMKAVSDGTLRAEDGLHEIADMVRSDIRTMKENGKGIEKKKQVEKFEAEVNGQLWHVSRVWSGHRFTDDEVEALKAGQSITFDAQGKSGDMFHVTGKLAVEPYKGRDYCKFHMTDMVNTDPTKERARGTWNGQEISFKRIWGSHRFTDQEVADLLADKTIQFEVRKEFETYIVEGKLENKKTDSGHKYVGFERSLYENKDPEKRKPKIEIVEGTFKKKKVRLSRVLCGHRFTDEEMEKLFNGETIPVYNMVSKAGKEFSSEVKLGTKGGRVQYKFGDFLKG